MEALNRRALISQFKPAPRLIPTLSELTVARRSMACEFSITFPGGCRSAIDEGCLALDEVERLEAKLSVFIDDSDVSRLNRTAASGPVEVDAELYGLLAMAARVHADTGGAFDAAMGGAIKAWRRGCPGQAICGSNYIVLDGERRTVRYLHPEVEYNLGAIGKGFAIDQALRHIRTPALMQGGQSSIKVRGSWTIQIGTAARVRLRDQAIGTSGTDNQFLIKDGRRLGHILDPRTGWPAEGPISASAITRSAAEADALSTAFYVLGVEGTKQYCRTHPEVSAVLVTPQGVTRMGPAEVEEMR